MRKFTLFIASLFIAIGAMAQAYSVTDTNLTADELKSKTEATYIAIKGLANTLDGYFTGNAMSTEFSNDAVFIWEPATENTAGTYYIKNLSGEYMQASSPKTWGEKSSAATFSTVNATTSGTDNANFNGDTSTNGYITSGTDANIVRFLKGDGSTWINLGAGAYNSGKGGWTIYYVYAVEVSDAVDVTYQYMFNGSMVKETTVTQAIGSDYAAPAIDYVTFAYPDGTVTAETTTVEVTCTQALPFTVSTSYADATWYYMSIRSSNEKWVARSESAPYTNSKTKTTDDNGLWAFIGNAFDGIQVINKGAGEGYTLGYDGTDTGSNIYMMEGTTSWIIEEGNGGFLLRQAADYEYAHDLSDKLAFWNHSSAPTDAGSAFNVYDPADNSASVAALQAAIDAANAKSAYIGTEIGLYTYTGEGSYADAIAEYQTYIDGITSTATPTPDEVDTKTAELNTIVASLTLNVPATGKYYRLKNVVNNRYMSANESSVTVIDNGGEAASTIFYLGENNTLLSYTQGRYLDCNAKNLAAVGTSHSGLFAAAYGTPAANVITYKNNGYWTFGARDNGVSIDRGSSTPNQAGYSWTIEEVTELPVAVSAAGVATFYTPVALTIPANVECYYIAGAIDEKGIVQLETINSVVPAGNGIVIKATEGTYNFTIGGEATEITGNLLEGTSAATYISKEAYVLANGTNGVGLYKAALTDGAFLNNANKAYFVPSTASGIASYSFNFDWEGTTGIEDVVAEGAQNGKIYDITGREVKAITAPGIYIVNGKKVVK